MFKNLRKNYFRLFLCSLLLCCRLQAMEQLPASLLQSAEKMGTFKSLQDQIIEDFMCSWQSELGHDEFVNLGLTCTSYDRCLRATAKNRKPYLLELSPSRKIPLDLVTWHAYGSRADCKVIIDDSSSTESEKKLILGCIELSGSGQVRECFGSWGNFTMELPCKQKPFYDERNRLCFNACGWIPLVKDVMRYVTTVTIHKGTISETIQQGGIFKYELHFHPEDEPDHIIRTSLKRLLNFPYLLQAILSCTKKQQASSLWSKTNCYIYDLQDVLLPDNYKEFIECGTKLEDCDESVLIILKKALARHYEEQQEKLLKNADT